MKTVLVSGATGFIGRHVVRFLQASGNFRVIATGRSEKRLKTLKTEYRVYDLNESRPDRFELLGCPDTMIHLAWEGLPNYRELFHIERNLVSGYRFLKDMVLGGLPSLSVVGTCYEYGLQSGCLSEEIPTSPTTSYGIAKDSLRRFLEALQKHSPFSLRWARLFFLYGEGQSEKTLISQLDQAISSGADAFDMSGGEQIRDYLPVEEAAASIVKVALQTRYDGIFNICSGNPISVRRLVEQHLEKRGCRFHLNLGAFPYPEHEPMAYWGNALRLRMAIDAYEEGKGIS